MVFCSLLSCIPIHYQQILANRMNEEHIPYIGYFYAADLDHSRVVGTVDWVQRTAMSGLEWQPFCHAKVLFSSALWASQKFVFRLRWSDRTGSGSHDKGWSVHTFPRTRNSCNVIFTTLYCFHQPAEGRSLVPVAAAEHPNLKKRGGEGVRFPSQF